MVDVEPSAERLTPRDPRYPHLLHTINDAPAALHLRGTLADVPRVAIVGSRACSRYGRQVALDLAAALAHRGVSVVSGLARGIDAAAHEGAIAGNGHTVAVLPGGLRPVYPARHRGLAERIVAQGSAPGGTGRGYARGAVALPSTQSHHRRHERRHGGRRGGRSQRCPHHRRSRARLRPRRPGGAGPDHLPDQCRLPPTHEPGGRSPARASRTSSPTWGLRHLPDARSGKRFQRYRICRNRNACCCPHCTAAGPGGLTKSVRPWIFRLLICWSPLPDWRSGVWPRSSRETGLKRADPWSGDTLAIADRTARLCRRPSRFQRSSCPNGW